VIDAIRWRSIPATEEPKVRQIGLRLQPGDALAAGHLDLLLVRPGMQTLSVSKDGLRPHKSPFYSVLAEAKNRLAALMLPKAFMVPAGSRVMYAP
jgi:hypothetical protein